MAGKSTSLDLDQLEPLAASVRLVVPEGLAGLGHRQEGGGVEPVLRDHVDVIALGRIRVRAELPLPGGASDLEPRDGVARGSQIPVGAGPNARPCLGNNAGRGANSVLGGGSDGPPDPVVLSTKVGLGPKVDEVLGTVGLGSRRNVVLVARSVQGGDLVRSPVRADKRGGGRSAMVLPLEVTPLPVPVPPFQKRERVLHDPAPSGTPAVLPRR